MANMLERKCAKCKGVINIERNHIADVIYFDKKYYHESCFEEMASQKAASKRGKPQMWQDALDNIWELEVDTKIMLERFWVKDDLNAHILKEYDIVVVPSRFWQIIADLENGMYKSKKCKPVSMDIILGAWRWGQKKLNEINISNKKNHKGPSDDSGRLMYDLSIIVSKIPNYLAHTAKMKAVSATSSQSASKTKINYDNLENKTGAHDINDISDLLNEIF